MESPPLVGVERRVSLRTANRLLAQAQLAREQAHLDALHMPLPAQAASHHVETPRPTSAPRRPSSEVRRQRQRQAQMHIQFDEDDGRAHHFDPSQQLDAVSALSSMFQQQHEPEQMQSMRLPSPPASPTPPAALSSPPVHQINSDMQIDQQQQQQQQQQQSHFAVMAFQQQQQQQHPQPLPSPPLQPAPTGEGFVPYRFDSSMQSHAHAPQPLVHPSVHPLIPAATAFLVAPSQFLIPPLPSLPGVSAHSQTLTPQQPTSPRPQHYSSSHGTPHAAFAATRLPILTPWLLANKRMGLPPSLLPPPPCDVDLAPGPALQERFQESLSRALSALGGAAPPLRVLPRPDLSTPAHFVSGKQARRLMQRMAARARQALTHARAHGAPKHRSRQLHASRRVRGSGGRFLTKEEKEAMARQQLSAAGGQDDGEEEEPDDD